MLLHERLHVRSYLSSLSVLAAEALKKEGLETLSSLTYYDALVARLVSVLGKYDKQTKAKIVVD